MEEEDRVVLFVDGQMSYAYITSIKLSKFQIENADYCQKFYSSITVRTTEEQYKKVKYHYERQNYVIELMNKTIGHQETRKIKFNDAKCQIKFIFE